jgi:hypothetical protein
MPEQPTEMVNNGVSGSVPAPNGKGCDEFPFLPTRHELQQLVRYWARRILEVDWFQFIYGFSDPISWRDKALARRRIASIAEVLGDTAVRQEIEYVRHRFSLLCDQRYWVIFNSGTKEEKERVCAQVDHEMMEWEARRDSQPQNERPA